MVYYKHGFQEAAEYFLFHQNLLEKKKITESMRQRKKKRQHNKSQYFLKSFCTGMAFFSKYKNKSIQVERTNFLF